MFWKRNLHGLGLFVFVILCIPAHGQLQDSTTIYKKIKTLASQNKWTTLLYQAVFVDPKPEEYPAKPAQKEGKKVNPYLKHQGAVIRNVYINVFDPFGKTVHDTISHPVNFAERWGNRTHVTTRRWVINNKLLFKKHDTLNALAISESERLLRQAVYVSDAKIFLVPNKRKDSVDVFVLVQDKWAITVPAMLTDIAANATFRNQNLFGLGQQFEQFVGFKKPNLMEYRGFYNVANIDNTYISGRLGYHVNQDGTTVGLAFDRPFYSPLAKWAGGASVNGGQSNCNYVDTLDGFRKTVCLNNYGYDLWLGKSMKLNTNKSFFNQSSNIIVGLRYYNHKYIQRPQIAYDIPKLRGNTSAFIGNVGIAVQQYYKDRFIYRFGANEDVPEGFIIQMAYGAQNRELLPTRYYLGIEIARATHFNFGYLTSTFSHSIFFNPYSKNNVTHNYRVYYFSNLLKVKRWYLREFVNLKYVYGKNKEPGERLVLSGEEMYGFNAGSLSGTKKVLGNFETVAYAPYNVIGFRFAPVALIGLGMIGNDDQSLKKSTVYQAYSLGLMVRNENLISSTFQISVGMYPFFPDNGKTKVIYNPVTSFTLRVRLFAISRPEFITY
jgi:hypothetical protein